MSGRSADDKLLGFEYQFFYFLLLLLKMDKEEVVGFEIKEDVHKENDDEVILYQLKHTIQTNSAGNPINLTTSDNDLWKTLSLWVDIIKEQEDKNNYLQNTKFIFVSNKESNNKNEFLNLLNTFKKDKKINDLCIGLRTYRENLEETHKKKLEKGETTKKDEKIAYLNSILSLDEDLLNIFFDRLDFKLGLDDIIDKIKNTLQYTKTVRPSRVETLFNELVGVFKEDFFTKVKNRELVKYTGEDFYLKTLPHFEKARSERLTFHKIELNSENTTTKDMIFAKQLADINITDEEIYDSDYNRLLIESNLKRLYQNGEITRDDIELFEENTIELWKEDYNQNYIDEKDKTVSKAKQLYYNVMKRELTLAGQKIEWRKASKGQFISMSNLPLIGWLYNWKSEYIYEK